MRPDDEVNVVGADKTAAYVATPAGAGDADSDKTVILARAAGYEPTVIAAAEPSDPVVPPASYDATQKTDGVEAKAYEKTTAFRPGAAGSPPSGDDKTDPEA
jgi:hypothetical protein